MHDVGFNKAFSEQPVKADLSTKMAWGLKRLQDWSEKGGVQLEYPTLNCQR